MTKNIFTTNAVDKLSGKIRVASDKSISHRALILGAIADGVTNIYNLLTGTDVLATANVFRKLGIKIDITNNDAYKIYGQGKYGLSPINLELKEHKFDVGNSGTAMRLLAGLFAGQKFNSILVGDESLTKRPMLRVADPLQQMGAQISTSDNGMPPLQITGGAKLQAIEYRMPVASAQVKSALLLAGLYADGQTSITEPAPTRDHTERMLQSFAYPTEQQGNTIRLNNKHNLQAVKNLYIPADISSAAFFMVAATIAKDADITLLEVGVNPTRTGIIDILRLMGADITLTNLRSFGAEPVADIRVRSSKLNGIKIPAQLVPLAIDEFPVIFVAASLAQGETILTDAQELTVKESNRITVMADGLRALGVELYPSSDGIKIIGGNKLNGGEVWAHGDHRIAMAFSVAGIVAKQAINIHDCANVITSFPNFLNLAHQIGMKVA